MMYAGDSGRFLTHVLGTGRLFAFSGIGGIRLSSAFADFAFLRPVLKKKNITEKTLYADSRHGTESLFHNRRARRNGVKLG